jgi:hypothetical protein
MKPLAERLKAVDERWKQLNEVPAFEPLPPREVEPTPEQRLAGALNTWVEDAPAPFWVELDKWVRTAHINARANIEGHAETAYSLGFEAAVEMVRDKFKSWRTTGSADSPKGD